MNGGGVKTIVVIGATGDVGRGIVAQLLGRGNAVVAVARQPTRLDLLAEELGRPAQLQLLAGSVGADAEAAALRETVVARAASIDGVVVSVNAPREPAPLADYNPESLARLLNQDLIAHFIAARQLLPALAPGGCFLGIGGGSCDFVLHDGIPQSMAQASLRMLYRGLAHEHRDRPVAVRELIVASVVNGASTRSFAQPTWVTEQEIGAQVAQIIADPRAHPGPILRIARRDASGKPVYSDEGPSRVQGFRTP